MRKTVDKVKRGKTVVTLEKPRWVQSLQKCINSWASSCNCARRAGYYWLPGSRHHGVGYTLNLNGALRRIPLSMLMPYSLCSLFRPTMHLIDILFTSFTFRFSSPSYRAQQLVAIPSMGSGLDDARSPATPPVYVFPSNIWCRKDILYPILMFPFSLKICKNWLKLNPHKLQSFRQVHPCILTKLLQAGASFSGTASCTYTTGGSTATKACNVCFPLLSAARGK